MLTLTALPPTHQLAFRKTTERRIREVVADKFRTPRSATPVNFEILEWRSIHDKNDQHVAEKPERILITFGAFDVSDYNVQLKAEMHFDSLYVNTGWSYRWDSSADTVELTEVPALPEYILFPGPGTDEFARLEALARRGIIVFGPAEGGGDAFIDFNEVPHTLVGGNTGRGKSVLLTIMLFWALYLPDMYELVVADPKRTDFTWTPEFPNVRFAATIPEIQAAISYAKDRMSEVQDLLEKYGVENVEYLVDLAEKGTIAQSEVPRRLVVFFDEMASFFTESKDEEIKVLQGSARADTEQIAQLGRAPWVNLFGAAQKPSDKNLGTLIRELMGNKVGIGWMKSNMSDQVLGNALASTLDRADTPKGCGWCLVDGEEDKLLQTYYLPKRTEVVPFAEGSPVRPGVIDIIRERLTKLGYVQVSVPNDHGGESFSWVHPELIDDDTDTPDRERLEDPEAAGGVPTVEELEAMLQAAPRSDKADD